MSQQIKIMEKNVLDISNSVVTITSTDDVAVNQGQSFVDLLRDRKNSSGWSTTYRIQEDISEGLDLEIMCKEIAAA